jgi:hypothetical protein
VTLECGRRRRTLFVGLGALYDGLDMILLFPPCLIVAPPQRSLVLAVETKVPASLAFGFALVALLSPQSAGEAPYIDVSTRARKAAQSECD